MTDSVDGAAPGTGRERALAAARDLFASLGYAEVSMQTIADAAGVNKATLYHHFGDKEELFVAVLGAEFEQLRAAISASAALDRPFRDHLIAVARILLEHSGTDKMRLMMQMHQHVSTLKRHKLHNQSPPPWTDLRNLFVAEIERGGIKPLDPEFGVTVLFGMAIFQAQRVRYLGEAMTKAELAEEVVDLFLLGACPRSVDQTHARGLIAASPAPIPAS